MCVCLPYFPVSNSVLFLPGTLLLHRLHKRNLYSFSMMCNPIHLEQLYNIAYLYFDSSTIHHLPPLSKLWKLQQLTLR